MNIQKLTPLALSTLLLFGAASCASTGGSQQSAPVTTGEKADKKDDEKQFEIADKERELRLAQMDLEVKQISTTHSMQSSMESAADAQTEVEKAEKALAIFREIDKPRRVREMELRIARAEFGIENSKQDLDQMKADYEGVEEFYAKKTGEIVVWRTETSLQFARDNHALTIQSRDKLMNHTLPDEEAELVHKLERKRTAHERATQKVETAKLETKATIMRAEAKIEKLQRELDKAKKEMQS